MIITMYIRQSNFIRILFLIRKIYKLKFVMRKGKKSMLSYTQKKVREKKDMLGSTISYSITVYITMSCGVG